MGNDGARALLGGWRVLTVTGTSTGPGTVPLRPMTLGDLLDEPFILLRAHLRSILLFVAAAVVPSQLLQAYLSRGLFAGFDLGQMIADPEGFSAVMGSSGSTGDGGIVVSLVNAVILLPLAVALVSRLGMSSVLGERLGDRQVVAATLRRLPSLAGTWLLALAAVGLVPGLGVLIAATGGPLLGVLLVVAGFPISFVAFVLLAPAPLIAVVEGRRPVAALKRSVELVRHRFGAASAALAMALAVSFFVQMAVSLVPVTLAFLVPEQVSWLFVFAGSTVASLIATPYTMLVIVVLYVDALVRLEALDIQRLLEPGVVRAAR